MEGNVLVELYDTVQGGLTCQGDERSADREQNHRNIEMESQRSSSCYGICNAKGRSGNTQSVFDLIIYETESEDHCVKQRKDKHKTGRLSALSFQLTLTGGEIQSTVSLVHHPSVKLFPIVEFLRPFSTHLSRHQHSSQRRPSRALRDLHRASTTPIVASIHRENVAT